MTDAPAQRNRRGGLWWHRDFRLFWTGETTSQVGTAIAFVTLPLVAVDTLHASTFSVTVLTASVWLPWLGLGLLAGAWVDRLRCRPIMLVCDTLSFTAFLSVPIGACLGVLSVGQLVAVALVAGCSSVFFSTAYSAYLPSIIPDRDLTEGNAKLTGSRSAAQVVGPGLGGAIVQTAGATAGLLANAISFAVSFVCLICIDSQEPATVNTTAIGRRAGVGGDIKAGLRFVVADPLLRPQLLFGAAANLALAGVDALLVVFLVRTVGAHASTVGVLLAVASAGGVLGAILAQPMGRRWGTSRTVVITVVGGLPFALLLPLTTPGIGLLLFVTANFTIGAAVAASNVITAGFRQTYVPAAMLGRVSASVMTVSYATMPAGALIAGGLAEAIGIRDTLWALTIAIATSGWIYLASAMRQHRDLPDTTVIVP